MSRDSRDGATATWGAQHFDSQPTEEQIARARRDETQAAGAAAPQPKVSVLDAAKTIKSEDFFKISQYPCHRQGYMTGIGAGAAIGVGRFVFAGSIPKAANWAVWGGLLSSLIAYEWCQASRFAEKAKMKRVVEVYEQKQAELKQRQEEMERTRQAEAEAARIASQRSWYRFW